MADQQKDSDLIETRIRVLTWNIWWRFGPWEQRRSAIAATLASLDADIIALQEVWSDKDTDQAAELGKALGYFHIYAQSMDKKSFGFGNAILSRWPIEKHDQVILSGKDETGEARIALFAQIDGPRSMIPVFSTHLNYKYDHSHIRQRQVVDLARFVDGKRPWSFPPIVCGDFNAEPDSDEIRMLKGLTACPVESLYFHDAWNVAGGSGPGNTWENINPYARTVLEADRRIDYIMVGKPGMRGAGHILDCRVTGNKPVDNIWPSDHHAVLAELRY